MESKKEIDGAKGGNCFHEFFFAMEPVATDRFDSSYWRIIGENLIGCLMQLLTNEVSRKASVSQGSALMRVAAAVFTEIPSLKTMREMSLGSDIAAFHHAPVFGIVCGLLGMDSETSQRAYMFITLRDAFSAATRLNLVGPLGAAVLQHQVSIAAETMLKRWMNREHTQFHISNHNRLVTCCELVKNSAAFWLLTMDLVDLASYILEKLNVPRTVSRTYTTSDRKPDVSSSISLPHLPFI
ncbi:UREASE ACCESSORY PROTEIN F [Salix koriyanagi]|uniref:UREASE ACCESSORY PROTEIN F n=1 Tax=Salix koriyanagi TaxID=2511006 RepID=A0A9Q0X2A8_9ROSI|nr:UREASE ACCESSORY PROTEIN F [Salix koriyanagi]